MVFNEFELALLLRWYHVLAGECKESDYDEALAKKIEKLLEEMR